MTRVLQSFRTRALRGAWHLTASLLLAGLPLNAAFDVTFYFVSDSHYKADPAHAANVTLGQRVLQLNALAGVELPGGLGPVGTPRGVIHGGDIIDGYEGLAAEWSNFTAQFGLDGTDGVLNVPVYENFGNHDLHYPVTGITGLIANRNLSRPGVTHVSGTYQYPPNAYGGAAVSGVHYAWQWGPVHFVNVNVRVGDSPYRYPSAGSHTFLREYLENVVGGSGAPVFIVHHLNPGAGESDWPAADQAAFRDLIKDYNVVGILHGHLHGPFTVTTLDGFRVFKTSDFSTGAYVFKIKGDANDPSKATMRAVGRNLSNDTWGSVNSYEISLPPVKQANITNPYAAVDWAAFGQHKANLHTHSTQSDGDEVPGVMIDAYKNLGYSVLAMTDHNKVTWPWSTYGRDSAALGMIAIQAAEASSHAHINSYFSGYSGTGVTSIDTTLQTVGANGGLAVFNHPGREDFTADFYQNLYLTYPHMVGMEVYNQDDRYPNDRKLWDQVLTLLMPGRPVWGYANDDAHRLTDVGHSWNTLLLPALTEANVRSAMESGRFYFCHAPVAGNPAPLITSIAADEMAGTLSIAATGWNSIKWISEGTVINTTDTVLDVRGMRGYVRAELLGPTGVTCTQPFFVSDPDLEPPPAPGNLTATVAFSTRVDLAWTDSADNETGFEIERRTGAEGDWQPLATVGPNTGSHADTSVSAATTYSYRVRAINLNGFSAWSGVATVTPQTMLPAAPEGLAAVVASSTRINLTWTDPATNETGFEIERKDGTDGAWGLIATVGANVTTYANTGLSASVPYRFRVRAINSDGGSPWSEEVHAIILLYGWVEPPAGNANFQWNLAANWLEPGYPNAAQAQATMQNTTTGSRYIYIASTSDVTVGRIIATESSNSSYVWQAGHTLTLDNGQSAATWIRNKGSATAGALRMHVYTNLQLNSTLVADWALQREMYLDNRISGPGGLVINHYVNDSNEANRRVFFRGGANNHAGGTILNGRTSATRRSVFLAEKNSAFGSGDVTLNEWVDLTLTDRGTTDDMIADTASLRLAQAGADASRVILNANVNETVNRLYLNGTVQAAGTWGSTASAAQNKNDVFFSGTGILTVTGTVVPPTPYESWATAKSLTAGNSAGHLNPDNDDASNLVEFAFNGDPQDGADNGRVHVLTDDGAVQADRELILTVAVRAGTPAFSGSPSPTASHDGITYRIQGGTSLDSFASIVKVLPAAVDNGLPPAGEGYEYRSFSLSGSEGLSGAGFLRVEVTQP